MRVWKRWTMVCVAVSSILAGCDTPEMPTREPVGKPAAHEANGARSEVLRTGPTVSSTVPHDPPTTHWPTRFRGHVTGSSYVIRSARPTDSGVALRVDIDGRPHTYDVTVGGSRAEARLTRADGRSAALTLEWVDHGDARERVRIQEAVDSEFVGVESVVRDDGVLAETYSHSSGAVRTWTFPDGARAGDDWQEEYRRWLPTGSALVASNPLIAHLRELQSDPSIVELLESLGASPVDELGAPAEDGDRLAGFLCTLGVRCTVHACIAAPGSPVCAACAGAMSVFCIAAWFAR